MSRRGFLQRKTWSEGSYAPRFAALAPYLQDRKVLDLGCTSGFWRDDWLHARVAATAAEAIGIDRDAKAIEAVVQRGYDIREGNAEAFDLGERFDVVLAGEIIEHLENPGGMLRSAGRHLDPDGRLVITTPNPFGFTNFLYRLKGRPRINGDHTAWYCEDTLRQLLDRCDFDVVEMRYLHYRAPGRMRGALARVARRLLPERLAWSTLIAIATPRPVAQAGD